MTAPRATLTSVLLKQQAATLGKIKVAMHGTVVAYNSADQTATIKPAQVISVEDPTTEALIPTPCPPVAGLPVLWPTGGGCALTFPLAPGDRGILLVLDRPTDGWRTSGVPDLPPTHARRFNLIDGVFLPSNATPAIPLAATAYDPTAAVLSAAQVKLGSSAAVSAVALAPLVEALLGTVKAWLDGHVHPDPTSGTTGPPTVPSPAITTVAATKVLAE